MKRKRYVPNLITDMAECDANYLRLCQLFPHMGKEDKLSFGIDATEKRLAGFSLLTCSELSDIGIEDQSAKVELEIYERCPYTTMLRISVTNNEDAPWIRWPTMEVRIYLDAKSAEVISFERHRNFKYRYALPNANMFQPDEKSQINKYLGELLTYCLHNGYSLETPVFERV